MPDMTLPQIPAAPAPTKPAASAARTADGKSEAAPDKDFSKVLDSQLQSEQSSAETQAGTEKPAEHAADEPSGTAEPAQQTAEQARETAAADGNPLPVGGKAATPGLAAAHDPLPALPATQPMSGTEPQTAEVATAVEPLPALAAQTAAAESARSKPHAAKPQPATTADALHLRATGPWKTGAAELPEPAQNAVAQAVRSAVADADSAGQPYLPLERFGAEIRAAAASTAARTPGLEAGLERLAASTTQASASSNATTGTPQAVQGLPQTDAAAARSALPTTTVDIPLRQPGWDQALSERVMWVASQKFQGAEIKLNPAHLGPIEVRVQVHQDQAQISFTAQHAPAREALEAALPRLREMFAASGYNQVDVNVSQHSFAEQQRHAQGFDTNYSGRMRGSEDDAAGSEMSLVQNRVTGLPAGAIDLFA